MIGHEVPRSTSTPEIAKTTMVAVRMSGQAICVSIGVPGRALRNRSETTETATTATSAPTSHP